MDSLEREARERKKKLLALTMLPLSVGFFVWQLQANTQAAKEVTPPPPSVKEPAKAQVQKVAGPVLAMEKEKIVVVPVGERDPFTPAFVTNPTSQGPSAGKPIPAIKPRKIILSELGPTNRMTPLPLPTLRPFEPIAPLPVLPGNTSVPPVKPTILPPGPTAPEATRPVMPYTLTGIVKGSPDVAILRHWDGSRRIARVGDALDKQYRLTLIEESFVVVSGDGDAITLRLGGDVRTTAAPEVKQ